MEGFIGNIEAETLANTDFRRVLFTGPDSQLVLMCLKPGEEIGLEKHELDQFIRIEEGEAEVTLDAEKQKVGNGFAIVVPTGTMHNVANSGASELKLYTLYTHPQHKPGTIQHTKIEAEAAEKEEHAG